MSITYFKCIIHNLACRLLTKNFISLQNAIKKKIVSYSIFCIEFESTSKNDDHVKLREKWD